MIRNYFKLAVRNLMKHKTFSFINIFGLSIGLTCCMLISLYIFHEYSYDRFHEKGDRIYQLGAVLDPGGDDKANATVPAAISNLLLQEYPEIEERARLLSLWQDDKTLMKYEVPGGGSRSFYETSGYIADPEFFEVFTYDFAEGNPATALESPKSLVVSEAIARKMFGDNPALGKQVRVSSSTNGDHDYTITGVFRPNGQPSHIDARFFMSVEGGDLEEFITNSTTLLNNNMFFTYFLLKPGASAENMEKKFPAFIEKYMGEELKARGAERDLFLTPLQEIHLESRIADNATPSGSRKYIYILASIAILTLLIACINFMNLSTSRSSKRSVEVGVRKVLGAQKNTLVWQFLGESLVMAFIGFLLAILFVQVFLPVFEQVAGREILLTLNQQVKIYLFFLLLAVLTGFLAGSYPALFLSSFKPVRVLKGKFSNSFAAISLRKGLVVFQFVIAVVLIIASVVISNQMDYMRSKDLGFEKDQQLVIPLRSGQSKANYQTLKEKIKALPEVQNAGGSFYYPGIRNPQDWMMYKEGNSMQDAKSIYINQVDESFLQTLGIEPVAGRLFSEKFSGDSGNSIILNQKAVAEMGFSSADEAVGNWLAFDWEGEQYRYDIVGVVNDFHFKDLHIDIEPYAFVLNQGGNKNYLIANLATGNMRSNLDLIEAEWKSLNAEEPFEYSFLDEDFQKNYQAEDRLSRMIRYFTIIAILISCLGLFGLAAFSAEQRIKEIGLRKVLGASVSNLVALLSLDFLKLVLVAILVASPLAWFIMNEWLRSFAYKISISWEVFALTTILAVAIAFITVSFQAIKAATVNPVKNLRTE